MNKKTLERHEYKYKNRSRKHWKTHPETKNWYNTFVVFYLNNKRLGCGYVTEASEPRHRRELARTLGISHYNKICFEFRKDRVKHKIING